MDVLALPRAYKQELTVVSNLRKRIEAIEKRLLPKAAVAVDAAVLDAALGRISNGHRATLKSALEAEIAGRALTDHEAAARLAFDYVCRQEYRAATHNDPLTEFERRYGGADHEIAGA
ncbi:MAG: hypothetical protein ABSB35_06540 [Bryobacteraceae bacterium]|jgi:hypothetical protein